MEKQNNSEKIKQYVCIGYVILQKDRKGISYLPYDADTDSINEIPVDSLCFASNKQFTNSVGCIIEMIQKTDNKYRIIRTVGHLSDSNPIIKKYRLESIYNLKTIELIKLTKKKLLIRNMIEDMTIKEIKKWVGSSYINKKIMRYYLFELF